MHSFLQSIEMRNGDPKGFSGDASRRQARHAYNSPKIAKKNSIIPFDVYLFPRFFNLFCTLLE